jgi:predicted NodU family carbamoyl transferase
VRAEKRSVIPAVTHVDGSGRLQTVSRETNPRYWQLLRAFEERTGVSALLNTSFNENEPIVHRPEEALDCFRRTDIDVLVVAPRRAQARPPQVSPTFARHHVVVAVRDLLVTLSANEGRS